MPAMLFNRFNLLVGGVHLDDFVDPYTKPLYESWNQIIIGNIPAALVTIHGICIVTIAAFEPLEKCIREKYGV